MQISLRANFAVVFLLYACAVSTLHAGSNPVGSSTVKGYFLGYANEAYLAEDTSMDQVREIEAVCKRRGKLWALGIDPPFTCTGFAYPVKGDYDRSYSVSLQSPPKLKLSRHALLFSTKPFPPPSWIVRNGTALEMEEAASLPALKDRKYAKALRNAKSGKMKVVELSNGKAAFFVLPWRVLSDGIVDEEEFLLLISDNRGAKTLVERRGKIVGYTDLNGDGVPELQISMNCDGRCESVDSVSGADGIRLEISVH